MNFIIIYFNFLLLFNFIFPSNQKNISKGIIKIIDEVRSSFIFYVNEEYIHIITSDKIYIINKENNIIKEQSFKDNYSNSSPFLLYIDKQNNYLLLYDDAIRYKISFVEENEIFKLEDEDSEHLSELNNFIFLGYILEKAPTKNSTNKFGISDYIIYGTYEGYICFYSISQNKFIKIFEEKTILNLNFMCKYLKSNFLICIYQTNTNLKISLLRCNNDKCEEKGFSDVFSKFSEGIIFDTLEENTKVICAKLPYEKKIDCGNYNFQKDSNDNYNFIFKNFFELSHEYNSNYCYTKNCKLIDFLSEYLFCCSCINSIICTRLAHDFNIINNFTLSIEGENSNLEIINNNDYLSIIFVNINNIYKKNIYPPHCKNISKSIDKELEINIDEFIDIKMDSNYFMMFEEFASNILTIKMKTSNSEAYSNLTLNFQIISNETKFKFIINNQQNIFKLKNLNIIYIVSIEETYSSKCSINLSLSNNDNLIENINIDEENMDENGIYSEKLDIFNPHEQLEDLSKLTTTESNKICYENCESCEGFPEINDNDNSIEQKCLKCINGYYFEFQTKNCFNNSIIEEGYYFSYNDSMFHKCNINCKRCKQGDTIDSPNCLSCYSGKYFFSLNNSCLNSCPKTYKINEKKNECILEAISVSEFKNQITKNISFFVNSTNTINGTDFIAMIYSVDDINPKEQIKKGISAIDLGNCSKIIKDYYHIPQEESFIVLNIESKKNKIEENSYDSSLNLANNIHLEIYDFSGRKLNLSICQENIKVMRYIGDVEELNIQSAKELAIQGIDIFNSKDNFFNDLCYYYNNKEGKDITINDRRKDIYQNTTFCQDGCIYDGMDYELMIANCICDSSAFQNDDLNNLKKEQNNEEKINFDSITKSFISNLFDFNFKVLKCYNLILNFEILKRNIGFYFMIVMFLFQIIFWIIYLIYGLKNIKYYMIIFQSKDKNSYLLINKKSNKKFYNNNNNQAQKYCFHQNKFYIDNSINETKIIKNKNKINQNCKHYGAINNKIFNNRKYFFKVKMPTINNKIIKLKVNKKINDKDSKERINETIIEKSNYNDISRHKILKKQIQFHHMKTNIKIENNDNKFNDRRFKIHLFYNDEDLKDIQYEQALIYEKRNFCKMYISFLIDSQIVLQTFFTENYLYLFIIKLSFFVYTLQISFFLNSLFYTDEYISDAYNNNGILDFISGLPKSIYSFFVTLITNNLLRMLSNNQNELRRLIKEKRKSINYRSLINSKLKKLKYKLIVYFIIVFILGLFFSYYVTSFCAVYKYSQKYLLYGFFESFAIDFGFSVISCVFLSVLRYISIKKKIKYLYILYKIISICA